MIQIFVLDINKYVKVNIGNWSCRMKPALRISSVRQDLKKVSAFINLSMEQPWQIQFCNKKHETVSPM